MRIGGEHSEPVLHGSGCDPDVVRGNRGSRAPQREKDLRIAQRRLTIHLGYGDSRRAQESAQFLLILEPMGTAQEAGLQFAQNDGAEHDATSLLH
jgi:hypothetical protein